MQLRSLWVLGVALCAFAVPGQYAELVARIVGFAAPDDSWFRCLEERLEFFQQIADGFDTTQALSTGRAALFNGSCHEQVA